MSICTMIEYPKILYTKTHIYIKSKITAINGLSSRKRYVLLACPHFVVALHASFSDKWIRKDKRQLSSLFKIQNILSKATSISLLSKFRSKPKNTSKSENQYFPTTENLFDKIFLFDNNSFFLSKLKQTISFAHHI